MDLLCGYSYLLCFFEIRDMFLLKNIVCYLENTYNISNTLETYYKHGM